LNEIYCNLKKRTKFKIFNMKNGFEIIIKWIDSSL